MIDRSEAEEHLRVIRSLMEKATIYRAISAEAALLAGSLSVIVAAAGAWLHRSLSFDISNHPFRFFWPWIGVLVLTGLGNCVFLYRSAKVRGDVFFSPGMRLALRCMIPSFLVGGVLSFLTIGQDPMTVFIWLIFYGLGLLSTASFAPRSISFLGWAFLLAPLILKFVPLNFGSMSGDIKAAHIMMGGTFGLFHLIYAACTWPRRAR